MVINSLQLKLTKVDYELKVIVSTQQNRSVTVNIHKLHCATLNCISEHWDIRWKLSPGRTQLVHWHWISNWLCRLIDFFLFEVFHPNEFDLNVGSQRWVRKSAHRPRKSQWLLSFCLSSCSIIHCLQDFFKIYLYMTSL